MTELDCIFQESSFQSRINWIWIIHFEKNNKDFSINIYEIDADSDKNIGPTFRTKFIRTNHINILGVNNVNQESMHYAYIASVKRLCYSQHSKAK